MQSLLRLSGRETFLVLACAMTSAVGARGAEQAERIVELPSFVVTDSRELPPPESWRYATIPGFEILTNGSERATQRLLRDFDLFRQALQYAWPMPNKAVPTTSLIIAGAGNKFDAFIPAEKARQDVAFASLLLHRGDQRAIVIDLQATTLNVLNVDSAADVGSGTDSGSISVEHDKQLYREYVRYLLSRSEPRLPAWYEEGMAQIVMKMEFHRRWIEFAKLDDPNAVSASAAMSAQLTAAAQAEDPEAASFPGAPAEDLDFNAALRRRALVPLDKFFAVTHDSPEALNTLGNNRWGKQAYAFVHMCLYGNRGKFQKPFATFLVRAAREPVTEAMFKECFGITYKEMLLQIRGYCEFTQYESKQFRSKKDGPDLLTPPQPVVFREATLSEIGRIKGEALVLAGRREAARTELISPYLRGERDPDLLAALGLNELAAGEKDRARKFLEAAVTGKTQRPEAAIELARMRYADALAAPAAQGRLSAAQVSSVIQPLLLARRYPPPRFALYEVAADTWMRSGVQPKVDDAALLIEGAQLFPSRLKLVYQAATISAAAGEFEAARALANHGAQYAPDAAGKQRFTELLASLPAASPAPEPAPVPSTAPSEK